MPCYSNYIGLDDLIPSRTGLYLASLPGIDVIMIDALRKSGNDTDVTWEILYKRGWDNLVSDVTRALADKFFVDMKLVSRDTSSFLTEFNSSGNSGVKLVLSLSRYSKIHVINVGLWSQTSQTNAVINFYDTDASGELLHSVTTDLVAGRNTIDVDADFEVDNLYVVIDSTLYPVKQTENKFYHGVNYLGPTLCDWQWYGGFGSVEQINGGGLNLKYVIECSIEKFVCDNINLFKYAFHNRLGLEICHERRMTENLNAFTTMTAERATELANFFKQEYDQRLQNSIKSQNIHEDYVCFNCKNTVSTRTSLP